MSKFTVEDIINVNGALTYKIGLLTADEMILSGYSFFNGIGSSYILNNASSDPFWILSPYAFMDAAYNLTSNLYYNVADSDIALRPVIALKSDTTISSGDGTSSNPFVIE